MITLEDIPLEVLGSNSDIKDLGGDLGFRLYIVFAVKKKN